METTTRPRLIRLRLFASVICAPFEEKRGTLSAPHAPTVSGIGTAEPLSGRFRARLPPPPPRRADVHYCAPNWRPVATNQHRSRAARSALRRVWVFLLSVCRFCPRPAYRPCRTLPTPPRASPARRRWLLVLFPP